MLNTGLGLVRKVIQPFVQPDSSPSHPGLGEEQDEMNGSMSHSSKKRRREDEEPTTPSKSRRTANGKDLEADELEELPATTPRSRKPSAKLVASTTSKSVSQPRPGRGRTAGSGEDMADELGILEEADGTPSRKKAGEGMGKRIRTPSAKVRAAAAPAPTPPTRRAPRTSTPRAVTPKTDKTNNDKATVVKRSRAATGTSTTANEEDIQGSNARSQLSSRRDTRNSLQTVELLDDGRLSGVGSSVSEAPTQKPRNTSREASSIEKPASTPSPWGRPESLDQQSISGRTFSVGTLIRVVTGKLTERSPTKLVDLDDAYGKVFQLLKQTVSAGESNTLIITGPRGCGKSSIVHESIKNLRKDHGDSFFVVQLDGLIHTDDKIALREIWKQLGREMDIEEDDGGQSYSDILAKLLALLESQGTSLEAGQVSKSVIFVIDEFDLFASHGRQTLLYNLFDIAQARKAPIAVLGLTTRMNVVEALEKRVKSRFSHRYVHLFPSLSVSQFKSRCKTGLLLHQSEMLFQQRAGIPVREDGTVSLSDWNAIVTELFEDEAFLSAYVYPVFYRTKRIQEVWSGLLLPITTLQELSSTESVRQHLMAQTADVLTFPDAKLGVLRQLSELQLSLLICAARLNIILETDTCNFNMAYDEYVSLAAKARIQNSSSGAIATGAGARVWSRDVARGEWEKLIACALLIPVSVAPLGGELGTTGVVRIDTSLEEIAGSAHGMDKALEKWCKQI